MPKPSLAADQQPASAAKALRDLGENLALARQRRKESLRAWASRMAVSVPTLIRMEKGDPSVGMGVYATALWLMGRAPLCPTWPSQRKTCMRWSKTLKRCVNARNACHESRWRRSELAAPARNIENILSRFIRHFQPSQLWRLIQKWVGVFLRNSA